MRYQGRQVFETFLSAHNEKAKFTQVSTFGGHPCSCAAALANLDILTGERLWENAAQVGPYLAEGLRALDLPVIGQVRSWGLLIGLELVAVGDVPVAAEEVEPILLKRGAARFLPARRMRSVLLQLVPPLLTSDSSHVLPSRPSDTREKLYLNESVNGRSVDAALG